MSRYVVAVSGGVDSVTLLDMMVKTGEHELIVAHFDHGIRPESDADARFVEGLTKKYGLMYATRREELGANASEEQARTRRYAFLHGLAEKHQATIATAHHADDIAETIAINIHRGTGWRGVAVLDSAKIHRPLLSMTKAETREYAHTHGLEWVEDETNATDRYLRNTIRARLNTSLSSVSRQQLLELWKAQLKLKKSIDEETNRLFEENEPTSRYFFTQIDEVAGSELLRALLASKKLSLTGPQRLRLLHAIKTAKPGAVFQASGDAEVTFTLTSFIVKTPPPVVILEE